MSEIWPFFIDPHLIISLNEEQQIVGSEQPIIPVVYPGLIRFDGAHASALIEAGIQF